MNIGKIISPAITLVLAGLIIPSAPSGENPRPGKGLQPVLSEHPPSPFKMPKPIQEGPCHKGKAPFRSRG